MDLQTRAEMAAWVRDHWDALFALCFRLSGSRHEAEDMTQEAFLRAGQQYASFTPGTNLRAWLMRIATNIFLDAKRKRRPVNSLDGDALESADRDAHPADGLTNSELGQALSAALLELPEIARTVFLLRTQEDLSFREIAKAIDTSEETARWHMLQARRRLMQRLDGWLT